MNGFLLFAVVCMLSSGQFLFKRAGLAMQGLPLRKGVVVLATLPSFYLALAIYGTSTMLYVVVLSRVPLSMAYPWTASVTLIVPLIGILGYGERVGPYYWAGIGLMIGGVLLTQIRASGS